ncbi:MAG: 50S ribosome-binding GTPase, partial [Oligoflexia bacterium]|nr:50S ribosome-binding GTPase [Oligoflexia bacterium]
VEEEKIITLSAAHSYGLETLQESIISFIQKKRKLLLSPVEKQDRPLLNSMTPREDVVAKLAIIGAPNSGKSTLLNRLLKCDRAIVSEIPGTTRDPIEGHFDLYFKEPLIVDVENENENENDKISDENKDKVSDSDNRWHSLKIVDTAGIRRKREVYDQVESMAVIRALKSIVESDIVLLVIDAQNGISHQDKRLGEIAIEKGKSLIIVLNKFDLLDKNIKNNSKLFNEWFKDIEVLVPWRYCALIPISAKDGKFIGNLKEEIRKTVLVRKRKISTSKLNQCFQKLLEKNVVRVGGAFSGNKEFKIKYTSVVKMSPPTILVFSNVAKDIPEGYRRYLANGIRENFNLVNTPVHLVFRTGKEEK